MNRDRLPGLRLKKARFRLALLLGLMLALAAPLPLDAALADSGPAQAPVGEAHSLDDPQELEAFIDGIMTAQLRAYDIPGAIVAVVKDGEPLLARGYGYANLETLEPARGDTTLFEVGSISKLFTWTAVMQLVEQGQLDLDVDVNTYLDFQIPATYAQPITLRHLLTHTPGFEDRGLDVFAGSPDDLEPLGQNLARIIPARVYPPGEISAYSNYGAALAGYIVERVSGVPFEQYVEEQIFQPLGMAHTTFRQVDIPPDLAANVAEGYSYANGTFEAADPVYIPIFPAGSARSTAADMARFMIAHLQDGEYNGSRILQEATAQEMHRQQFTNHPAVSGITLGFIESNINGLHLIGHGGDTVSFHTLLVLIPEHNAGLFVSYNSMGSQAIGAVEARGDLQQAFLDRYYPAEKLAAPQPPADFASRAGRFTGAYIPSRSSHTTPEKVVGLMQPLTVRAAGDGALLASYGPIRLRLVETGPLEFFNSEDQTRVVFQEDARGAITHLFLDSNPIMGFIKLPWYASPALHQPILIVCLGLFVTALIAWPIRLSAERRQARASGEPRPLLPRLARWTGTAVALLNVVYIIGTLLLFMSITANPTGVPPALPAAMTIPVLTALLALAMLAFSVLAWKNSTWKIGGRLFYSLVTLAALVFIVIVDFWNLWIIGL